MTIDLSKDVEDFLRTQVRNGSCTDPNEFVNDLIRLFQEQQKKSFEATPELEAWLLEGADEPTEPLTHNDFEAIRQRVRARTKS